MLQDTESLEGLESSIAANFHYKRKNTINRLESNEETARQCKPKIYDIC